VQGSARFSGVLFPGATQLRIECMTKAKFLMLMGFSGLLLVGCSGSAEPELSVMGDEQAQADIPVHVGESEHLELENIAYVGEGEGFSVFAARDSEDRWCVVLYNEPPADDPGGWHVGTSCASSEDFAEGRGWVQGGTTGRVHTAQLLPDNFTGEIDPDLERINDNLAAK